MMVGTVLVVEDEPLILLDVETALHEAGFEVVAVTDAVQALAAFDAEPWQVQAIPTIPVVYMSGDSAIHWGAEGVPESVMITKPFFLPQIITALSTLLNQQPVNLGNSD